MARATSAYLYIESVNGNFTLKSVGRYEDELVKEDDGKWRLARRRVLKEMPSD